MGKHVLKSSVGLPAIFLLIVFSNVGVGQVTVGISITNYTNLNGTCYQENSSERKCCDGPQRADCETGDTCDTYFDICVGRMQSKWGCKGAFIQTRPLNDTNVINNVGQMEGESNFWGPGMGIFIFIRDSDSTGVFQSHDHIDTLIQILSFNPDSTFENSVVHQYEWNGNNVEMRISIQAWCSKGYYGTYCKTYCQGIPPIAICTASTGDLVCQSPGALVLQFKSSIDKSMFAELDLGVNKFMDEQVCLKNTSNVQYAQIDSNSQTLTFEGFCGNKRITPLEFESLLLLKADSVFNQYFKREVVRGPVVTPQGYGEHINPNVYIGVELLSVDHPSGTSYDGDKHFGERKCCDVPTSTSCATQLDTCDLQFSICVGDISNGICIGAVVISSTFDNTTSLFTCGPTLLDRSTGITHVSHPMIGGMRLTKTSSNVQVIVKDIDLGGSSFDTVDVLNTTIAIMPGPNITSPTILDVTLDHFVTLKLRMIFWCAPGHSGPLCSATNGTDHCASGWSGNECDIPLDSCHPNPCNNSGVCTVTSTETYSCTCDAGFTGINCTQDINECDLYEICENNGTCVNSYGAFNCKCTDGWTGLICSEKLPYCNPTPCLEGKCSPVYKPVPGYKCTCHPGWSGRNCDNKDDCNTSTCINGKCVIVDGVDVCMCTRGYSGKMCTEDIDECLAKPCKNGGICLNTFGGFNCTCPAGFSGQQCEILPKTCVLNECQNSGSCKQNGTSSYCVCAQGYTGSRCEQLLDKCLSVQCKHGEQCEEKFNDFQCNCSRYWSGKTCDADVNECSMFVCQNAVKCYNFDGSYYCDCLSGWNGTDCDTDINECISSPCQNGTCLNTNGSYSCQCDPGFTGKNCMTQTNFCSVTSCNGHGSCQDGDNKGVCTCYPGYTGVNCDMDINECNMGICGNHSLECLDTAGSYNCTCSQGWQGQTCSKDINECDSTKTIPCSGNGFCTNLPGTFKCNCLTGFIGLECDKFENSCNNIKCSNNATCEIRDEGPACVCTSGWSGLKCEIDIDECESFPCTNSGTCLNKDGSFQCACYSGWSGALCQTDVDECLDMSTCSNNGSCSNVPGTYQCACQKGWQGMSCEVISPGALKGNVIEFTFKQNITSEYQQPMISYLYHFMTTYVCSDQQVLLYIDYIVSNVIGVTTTCGGHSVSKDMITDGFKQVPNETLPRLFPLSYQTFRQTLTEHIAPASAKNVVPNNLGTGAIVAIVVSVICFILLVSISSLVYFKRRKQNVGDDPSTPYYKMDDMN